MIQRKQPGAAEWHTDLTVSTTNASDVQSLVEQIVRRYGLMGAVVATDAGEVRAHVGPALADATDGFAAALAGDANSLASLADAIRGKTLPRYFSQGVLDAYADIPAPGLIALFMRDRADQGERSELQLVSDYNVAKEMTDELRTGLQRLGFS